MFGKNGMVKERASDVAEAAADVVESMTPLATQVAEDEKLRARIFAAVQHGAAARRRARRQMGWAGAALRLAGDEEFRRHATEMVRQLKKAQARLERKRSHRTRNVVLLGFGSAAAAAAVPQVRTWVMSKVGGGSSSFGGSSPYTSVEEQIEVDVPVSTAYNQWTQFEEFPRFMEGVERVDQLDDTRLHWVATVAGRRAEWDAKILEQQPDTRISWTSIDGKDTRGTVSFDKLGEGRTQIRLSMSYRPEGLAETAGSAAGLDARRIRGDLQRFKDLIEGRGVETGAWRGEVQGGVETDGA
jgi:uncharacterized membrane protein